MSHYCFPTEVELVRDPDEGDEYVIQDPNGCSCGDYRLLRTLNCDFAEECKKNFCEGIVLLMNTLGTLNLTPAEAVAILTEHRTATGNKGGCQNC